MLQSLRCAAGALRESSAACQLVRPAVVVAQRPYHKNVSSSGTYPVKPSMHITEERRFVWQRDVTCFNFLMHLQVVDHYENPRNVGSFGKSDADVGTGLVGAPACGDVMKLQIKASQSTFRG